MTLAAGTRLGPYEVQSAVGAGGMGEVYRARDTRLDRTVAIKVLPSHLSSNADLRARFEREAKTISTFQHPNICVLHDVGRQDEVDFLVMEFLEGETLQARLARKPLTTHETLQIAIELAGALEKAHRSGIIHRDLKPGNVMLTKGGAKLMDFGLAKPNEFGGGSKSGVPAFSAAATLASMASPVTQAGTIVGTLQYMSPEQIQGKEADPRSDIFAFGAMLYEMVTGKRAFEGKSQLSVASAVLEKDPDPVSTVQPLAPPALEQVIATCLAKDPEDRFQSAHDLKLQLQWISTASGQLKAQPATSPARRKPSWPLIAALACGWAIAIAAAIVALSYAGRLTSAQQLMHAQVAISPGTRIAPVISGPPALSPDGQVLAFVVFAKDETVGSDTGGMIDVQRMNTGITQPLPGTEGGRFPFWSPDGKYLGFFSNGKLKKVEANGGPAQVLCDAPDGRGASWGSQGTIVFAPRIEGPLFSVPAGGGTPTQFAGPSTGKSKYTHRNPFFLPDGKHFLYTARGDNDPVAQVYAGSLDGSAPKQILAVGSNVSYSDGYLFYLKGVTLTAQRFNASTFNFEGIPVPIAANIEYYNARDMGFFAVNQNALVYRTALAQDRELAWLDLSGRAIEHWGEAAPYAVATYSTGSQMAILSRPNPSGPGNSLWLVDPQRKTVNRLTSDSDLALSALVAADGSSVFVGSSTGYGAALTRRWLTASAKEEKIWDLPESFTSLIGISKDGRFLLLNSQDQKTGFDIDYVDLQGDKKLVPILNSTYGEYTATLSPDNKWLAYVSDETGRPEVYVTPFPGGGAKWQASTTGITLKDVFATLEWSPDGKNLRYQLGDKILNVEVHLNGEKMDFSPSKEIVNLPPGALVVAILPDGKRTLVAQPTGDHTESPIDLIQNWRHLVQ